MLFSRHKSHTGDHEEQTGRLLDRGWRYDAEVWLFDTFVMHGQIDQLRKKVLDRCELGAGRRLLDVGCGTGTLAIQAARRLGGNGHVAGIDAAPRQIARAQAKARRGGCEIEFRQATIQDLPFADQSFDTVTTTLMMHHLPAGVKDRGLAEIHRVLKPQGRLVAADFDTTGDHGTHRRDGQDSDHETLSERIARAGFTEVTSERISFARERHGWSGATINSATKS